MALCEPDEYEGGGTFFPASGDPSSTGFLLRPGAGACSCVPCCHLVYRSYTMLQLLPTIPTPAAPASGTCVMHGGKVLHAGNKVARGTRYVLVAFFEPMSTGGAGSTPALVGSTLRAARARANSMRTFRYPRLPAYQAPSSSMAWGAALPPWPPLILPPPIPHPSLPSTPPAGSSQAAPSMAKDACAPASSDARASGGVAPGAHIPAKRNNAWIESVQRCLSPAGLISPSERDPLKAKFYHLNSDLIPL